MTRASKTSSTLAAHGSREKYVHDLIGRNSRLDAMQAVVLRAKLRRMPQWNVQRQQIADRYLELLSENDAVRAPRVREGNSDVWHIFAVQVDDRDRVAEVLRDSGVEVGIHYPTPIHLTRAYAHLGLSRGAFPVTEAAADRLLSLPMSPHLTESAQTVVVDALARATQEK